MKGKLVAGVFAVASAIQPAIGGSVIFIHPDGAGVANWQAARIYWEGPDANLNWDKLPAVAVYRGHMLDNLTATSNGGATSHAYGVKVHKTSFGSDENGQAPVSAAGVRKSLLHEAIDRGIGTGLINSGSVIEPGTAAFAATARSRSGDSEGITLQVLESGTDIILSGGEEWMLPLGITGYHGSTGKRTDDRDLIAEAKKRGYLVVYDKEQLAAVPDGTKKLLGVFAAANTFNDETEETLRAARLPLYDPQAPTLAEMTQTALRLLGGRQFFLVVEEEGSDNFANCNNAIGTLTALKRADDAFGVVLGFLEKHRDTLLITAADSEAGGMDIIGIGPEPVSSTALGIGRDRNGAPFDTAADGQPFESEPDRFGKRMPFVVAWAAIPDTSGGILARAAGKGSEKVKGTVDNTDIYRIMREVLFDTKPPQD